MIFGVGLLVFGYAVFYWGIHHFQGVDCPSGNNCRYSFVQVLGIGKYIDKAPPGSPPGTAPGAPPVQFK